MEEDKGEEQNPSNNEVENPNQETEAEEQEEDEEEEAEAAADNPSTKQIKEEIADDLNDDPAADDDDEEEMEMATDEENDNDDADEMVDDYVPKDLDDALKPRMGMVFDSVNEAFSLFKAYAYHVGFHAVRRTVHNYEGLRYRSTFTCTHGGKPRTDAAAPRYPLRSKRGRQKQQRRARQSAAEKTGCKAMMIIRDKRVEDKWKVELIDLEHNHDCTPDMVRFLKAYRELPESAKKKAKITDEMDESVDRSFSEIAETRKFPTRPKRRTVPLPAGLRISRNEIVFHRLGDDDIEALKRFVSTVQTKKPGFYHSWDFDQDGRLSNVFWADPRSRAQFQYFGDIITLDIMYLHARSTVPLAAFLGVNNHGHLVLLGCGLLADQSKESYVWLLKKWLKCMNGKPPEAITTNYSEVMAEAVAEVLPNARHRFCFWNILKKLQENVGYTHEKEAICSRFKEVVYDTVTLTDFEREWGVMVEHYKLKDNEWLSSLYGHRKQWAPGYVNHSFWAGTSAIRRIERPDPYFDGIVTTKTSLQLFLEQYETAWKNKLEREAYDDLRSYYSRLTLLSGLPFEEQLADLYTVTMFQAFQDEIKQLMHVICNEADRSGPVITYMASELIEGKKVDYTVVYNNADKDVWCICRSFQSRGILCSHALAVLKQENVTLLPAKYILNRWRKDFKILHAAAGSNNVAPEQELSIYDDLYLHGHQYLADVVDIGAREPELKEFVLAAMKEGKEKVVRYEETQGDGRVDVNMASTARIQGDRRVDVNMASSPALMQMDRRVDVNMASPALIQGDRRVDVNMASTALMHGRVDMNMASTAHNGGHSYNLLNVNLETDSLTMAPTNFMQVHPSVFSQKRLLDPRDQVMDGTNKRPNIESSPYFMGGDMHVG